MLVGKGMNEGSKLGYIISLSGGIIWLLVGVGIFGWVIFDLIGVNFVGGGPEERGWFLWRIGSALYVSIVSIWVIVGSFWMNKEISLRKGAMTSLILGILSLNVVAIIGGIFGLRDLKRVGIVGPVMQRARAEAQSISQRSEIARVNESGNNDVRSSNDGQVRIIGGGKTF